MKKHRIMGNQNDISPLLSIPIAIISYIVAAVLVMALIVAVIALAAVASIVVPIYIVAAIIWELIESIFHPVLNAKK